MFFLCEPLESRTLFSAASLVPQVADGVRARAAAAPAISGTFTQTATTPAGEAVDVLDITITNQRGRSVTGFTDAGDGSVPVRGTISAAGKLTLNGSGLNIATGLRLTFAAEAQLSADGKTLSGTYTEREVDTRPHGAKPQTSHGAFVATK